VSISHLGLIRRLRKLSKDHGSQKAAALFLGISQQYFNDVMIGRRAPGRSVLKALGVRLVKRYEEAK
jgi:hypothetical protein